MQNIIDRIIIEPLNTFFERFINFLPSLLSAIFIFTAGIALGFVVRFFLLRILRALGLDGFAERIGMIGSLRRAGIREQPSFLIANLFFWIIIILSSILALRALNISVLDRMLERFVFYLPNVFVAAIILVFGYLLANFISRAVLIGAVNAGLRVAGLTARLAKLAVFILAVSMALEQLGIGKGTITVAFAILFGGSVLSLAIAFGLGGKDIAKDYLESKLKGRSKDSEIDHL